MKIIKCDNCVLIGFHAGEDLEDLEGVVILGDNIRNLEQPQENVLFLNDKVAIGTHLMGTPFNLKAAFEFLLTAKYDLKTNTLKE